MARNREAMGASAFMALMALAMLLLDSAVTPVAAATCPCNRLWTFPDLLAQGCTDFSGGCGSPALSVEIRDIPDPDLTALSACTFPLNTNFTITNCPNLQSLAGLEWVNTAPRNHWQMVLRNLPLLTDANGLDIRVLDGAGGQGLVLDNTGFRTLDTLSQFQGVSATGSATGALTLRNNAHLLTLRGLGAQDTLSGLVVENNPLLANLSGLHGDLLTLSRVVITGNPVLTHIDALHDGAPSAGAYTHVVVQNNARLASIQGLSEAGTTIGVLTLANLPALLTFSLDAVTSVDTLTVRSCAALQRFQLSALTQVTQSLTLADNPQLVNLDGLLALTRFGSRLTITANGTPYLTSLSGLGALLATAAPPLTTNITVTDACCLTRDFYSANPTSPLTLVRMPLCIDCMNVTHIDPAVGPNTGSQTVTVRVVGRPVTQRVQFTFGSAAVNGTFCDTNSADFSEVIVAPGAQGAAAASEYTWECKVSVPAVQTALLNTTHGAGAVPIGVVSLVPGVSRQPVVGSTRYTYESFASFSGGYSVSTTAASPSSATYDPFTSALPGTERSQSSSADLINLRIYIVFASLIAVALLAVYLAHRAGRAAPLKRMDLYLLISRDPQAGTAADIRAPVYREAIVLRGQETVAGGTFSVVCGLLAIGVLATFAVSCVLDNDISTISYRPTTTTTAFVGGYSASVTFIGFNGDCSATGLVAAWDGLTVVIPDDADDSTAVADDYTDLTYTDTTYTGRDGLTEVVACRVDYSCSSCTLASNTVGWSVSSTDDNLWVIGFDWQFSSTDFFGSRSTAGATLGVSTPNTVWKGAGQFVASVAANPSTLSSHHYGGGERSGVLMKYSGQLAGSSASITALDAQDGGPHFLLHVTALSSTLYIQVAEKLGAVSILAQILAIISGAHGFGRVLLSMFQSTVYGVFASPPHDTPNARRTTVLNNTTKQANGDGDTAHPVNASPGKHYAASSGMAGGATVVELERRPLPGAAFS